MSEPASYWHVLASVLLGLSAAAHSATARLDDSASPRNRVPAQVALDQQGRPLSESFAPTTLRARFGTVEYRLATAPYVGQHARIYFVVPPQIHGLLSPAAMRVEWRGVGAFSGGTARPGERVLVWSGIVRTPWMNEAIDLSMSVDLHQVRLPDGADLGMESYFEIETQP
jgi:hypothetical protein